MLAANNIKHTIETEIKQKLNTDLKTIDSVCIMIYSSKKNELDYKLVQKINDYYQGVEKETFVAHLISSVADLLRIFSDIETITDLNNCRHYFASKLANNENMCKLLDIDLETHLKDMLFDEVSGNIRLQMALISLKILFNEIKPYYEILKIPEFDVSQLREVIQKAIEEFKKTVPGCDEAFSKLLKSLDTFSGNFGQYYE